MLPNLQNFVEKALIEIYVMGCRPSVSVRGLRDLGELHSSSERDSSFPRSTPGAVPSIPMRI